MCYIVFFIYINRNQGSFADIFLQIINTFKFCAWMSIFLRYSFFCLFKVSLTTFDIDTVVFFIMNSHIFFNFLLFEV